MDEYVEQFFEVVSGPSICYNFSMLLWNSFASVDPSWKGLLAPELELPYMRELDAFLETEKRNGVTIFPPEELIFNAFCHTPFEEVSVVILGQDPYHGVGQAEGLAFSVPQGVELPPSLKNIFKELQRDGWMVSRCGSLAPWANQGVFLLNTVLTVRKGEANSHRGKGWERFTKKVLQLLWQQTKPTVFLLWGKPALQQLQEVMRGEGTGHLILTAPHPSPLSAHRGFLGCGHFSAANKFLREKAIDWSLP